MSLLSSLARNFSDEHKALPQGERSGEPAKRLLQFRTFLSDGLTAFILHVAHVLRPACGLSARRSLSSNGRNYSPPDDEALLGSYGPKLGEFLIFLLRVRQLAPLPTRFPSLDTEHGQLVKTALDDVVSAAEEYFSKHREPAKYTRPKMLARAERVAYLKVHMPTQLWSRLHRLFSHLYFYDMGRYVCQIDEARFPLVLFNAIKICTSYATGLSVLSRPATKPSSSPQLRTRSRGPLHLKRQSVLCFHLS